MSPVAPLIVSDVSYVTGINHACHCTWQAQYLVTLEGESCAPRILNDVSYYVTGINHACHFTWQAQYLVTLEGEPCCSAHCK